MKWAVLWGLSRKVFANFKSKEDAELYRGLRAAWAGYRPTNYLVELSEQKPDEYQQRRGYLPLGMETARRVFYPARICTNPQ